MVEGLVLEYNKGEGFFCKKPRERGWTLKGIVRRAGGSGQKCPLLPLSPATETGEGEGRRLAGGLGARRRSGSGG